MCEGLKRGHDRVRTQQQLLVFMGKPCCVGVAAGPRPGSGAGGGTLSNGAGSDPYGVMAAAMGKGPDFQMQASG